MIFGNPWGLLGLLAIPAIIILHLFRQRFQPHYISTLFLFGPEQFNQASGSTREKLRRTGSLIAELLAALALTWFLSDPHLYDHQQARHIICILDSHQRLNAKDSKGHLVVDKAKAACQEVFQTLNSHDRITLIQSGIQPKLLTATAVPIANASLALDRWKADQTFHSLQASIEMAIDLKSASEEAHVIVLSDHKVRIIPDTWQSLSFGEDIGNSGIIDARWFNDERGQRISLRIWRKDDNSDRKVLITNKNNEIIASSQLKNKNGTQHIILPITKSNINIAHIQLTESDQYALDDSCSVVQPPRKLIRVKLNNKMAMYKYIKRALASTHKVEFVENAGHISIDKTLHTPSPGTWQLQIVKQSGPSVIGPFLSRSGHPLLQDLDFTGVLWSGTATKSPAQQQSLLQASQTCLISENVQNKQREINLFIDIKQSNLHKHPAWPSLFANLVEWRLRFTPGLQFYHLSSQMTNRIVLPPKTKGIFLQYPSGEPQSLTADLQGVIQLPRSLMPGTYHLTRDQQGTKKWQTFIVHRLDQRSSDFSNCQSNQTEVSIEETGKVQRIRTRLEHILPLAFAIMAALGAWICYRKEQGMGQ